MRRKGAYWLKYKNIQQNAILLKVVYKDLSKTSFNQKKTTPEGAVKIDREFSLAKAKYLLCSPSHFSCGFFGKCLIVIVRGRLGYSSLIQFNLMFTLCLLVGFELPHFKSLNHSLLFVLPLRGIESQLLVWPVSQKTVGEWFMKVFQGRSTMEKPS